MDSIKSFFEDNSGGLSSYRLIFAVWGIGVFAVWMYVCISSLALVPLPSEIITILLGLSTGKIIQRNFEKETTN